MPPSCMRISMLSMRQSNNYSTLRCAANPSPLAAEWYSPPRMKQSHLGSVAVCRAGELCPQLTFVDGHFQDYQRLGDAAIDVLNDFTPLVERISIDEAFADVA